MSNRPTPTALKIVLGNPGKRDIVQDDFKPSGAPVRPPWLKGIAAKKWDTVAPQLILAGVLTAVDSDMFAAYCALAAEFQKSKGSMMAARISQMRALASEFGLGAASRTRIRTDAPAPPSPAKKYFT